MSSTSTILRVGILTADEGAKAIQAIYLPALRALPTSFQVQAIHDGSKQPLSYETDINGNICNDHDHHHHHQQQYGTGTSTTIPVAPTPDDILSNPTIDLILNFMPNEYHETYTIAALHSGKHVMVETPLSLSIPSAKRIIEAEKHAPNGAKVFVACARRYAPSIASVFRQEVASLDRIYYARCRNIAGPSSAHTATAPRKQVWNEVNGHGQPFPISPPSSPSDSMTGKTRPQLLQGLLEEAFLGQDLSKERVALCEFLASLGCHDLGLMRDTLGYPDAVSSISVNEPYYSAVFHYYSGGKSEHAFTLMYETGTDAVPRCDAHLTIYGDTKTVSVQYGLPYGRRHGVKVVVETVDENGDMKRSETVSAWEESYREELKALHAYLTEDRAVKTTAKDAIQDLRLFQTIFEQYDRQCGTIRTPLG